MAKLTSWLHSDSGNKRMGYSCRSGYKKMCTGPVYRSGYKRRVKSLRSGYRMRGFSFRKVFSKITWSSSI